MIASDDVRRVTFDRSMRGYRCEDVDDYLKQVAESMDALTAEAEELRAQNDDLKRNLEILARRIDQYRADESSLSTAMINAQRLGENVIKEAKQKAAEIIRVANINADDREQRARDEVELSQQEVVVLKQEADAFKKRLMELYRQHIEMIAKIPECHTEPADAEQDAAQEAEEPASLPEPQPELEQQPEASAQRAPLYEDMEDAGDEPAVQEPAAEQEKPAGADQGIPSGKKVDTVEFAFAPRADADTEDDDDMPSVAGLYDDDALAKHPKRGASRPRAATRSNPKPGSHKAKPAPKQELDEFENLDYDV